MTEPKTAVERRFCRMMVSYRDAWFSSGEHHELRSDDEKEQGASQQRIQSSHIRRESLPEELPVQAS